MSEQMSHNTKLSKSAVGNLLTAAGIACGVEVYDTIDSTNTEAKRLAANGQTEPLLILAEGQTAGRGRMGREFFSPDGTGLYMSYMYTPEAPLSDSIAVTAAAAVAVARAVKRLCCIEPSIKWVNDIYISGKKVCGILTEAITAEAVCVIVGIGINITTERFPDEISGIADSLKTPLDRNALAAEIIKELVMLIAELPDRTFIDDYRKLSCVLGRDVIFFSNGAEMSGKAVDIDLDGGLIVETEKGAVTLNTGEISLRVRG